MNFDQQIYGGLQTTNPALIALQLSVLAPQAYTANVDDTNTSGQITVAYKVTEKANLYGTFATGFKSVGLNLNGLPTDALGRPILSAATVKPEDVHNFEVGLKTTPHPNVTANVAVFDTEIKDYQAQVTNGTVGVIRGYLANAEKVRVAARSSTPTPKSTATSTCTARWPTPTPSTSPSPTRRRRSRTRADRSSWMPRGRSCPAFPNGRSRSAANGRRDGSFFSRAGEYFAALDTSYRSSFSSSATYSQYMVIPSYSLLNARVGFRVADGWTLSVWSRNLLNKDYFELMSAQPGNSGLIEAQPGDPRTAGVTLRVNLRSR